MAAKPKAVKKSPPKKRAKKQEQRRAKNPAANLPEPVDVQPHVPQLPPKPQGLLSGLGDLFKPQSQDFGSDSQPSSTVSPAEALPAESERLLAAVPERIGGEADDPGGPADVPGQDDPIAALMAQVAFEPQDVQDVIEEGFAWLAEHFHSEHWKLTERQSRMLGKPAALLANSLWAKLQAMLPDILGRWCEETPGAAAFILACGIVVVPKVTQQVAISRERAKERATRVGPQSMPAKAAQSLQPKPGQVVAGPKPGGMPENDLHVRWSPADQEG